MDKNAQFHAEVRIAELENQPERTLEPLTADEQDELESLRVFYMSLALVAAV